MNIWFTGKEIQGFGGVIPVTCIVRNELNGWRKPDQVLREADGRISKDGTPYQPRPFPPGRWQITEVTWKSVDSLYWPVFIKTDAWQWLDYWSLDGDGHYDKPGRGRFRGYGYGIHHARVESGKRLVTSNTTLGCQNVLSSDDARWLGEEVHMAMKAGRMVYIDVPPWKEWKE